MAYGRKQYGASQTPLCVFCCASAYSKNSQGFIVCSTHKQAQVGPCKCSCGQWLDEREGKFGKFFSCMQCGAVNISKAKAINPDAFKVTSEQKKVSPEQKTPEKKFASIYQKKDEVVIKSTDLDWYC